MQVASNTASLAIAPVATPVTPAVNAAPSGEDHPFAKMLSSHQAHAPRADEAKPAQAKADTPAGKAASADDAQAADADEAPAKGTVASKRFFAKPSARTVVARDTADTSKKDTAVDAPAATGEHEKPAAASKDDDAAATPALPELFAALNPSVPTAAGAGADACKTDAGAALDGAPDNGLNPIKGQAAASSRHDAVSRDARRDKLAEIGTAIADGSDAAQRVAAESDPRGDGKHTIDARIEASPLPHLPEATPLAASHASPRQDSVGATNAPASIAMSTPATAPEFREALGVQVSVLARDGVQHAELHLNPADMGPISVQIALTGTQAQVDFGADSFATRQIIESGLPELASALRDAGFTLAGGGVSQHSRGREQGASEGHASAGGTRRIDAAGDAGGAAPRRTTLRLPQGAVDLYA